VVFPEKEKPFSFFGGTPAQEMITLPLTDTDSAATSGIGRFCCQYGYIMALAQNSHWLG